MSEGEQPNLDEQQELDMESEGAPPIGNVQKVKDVLAGKKESADADTPAGMEFVGWTLDGWVSSTPLYDANARPVYAFLEPKCFDALVVGALGDEERREH